ncbi:MAG: hypothetical protein ACRECY_10230 [Phyllobacterium sp.]
MKYLSMTIAKSISFLIFALTAIPAADAGYGSGLVTRVYVIDDQVIFAVDRHDSAPACGIGAYSNEFVFSATSASGKNMYALLLAAASNKKQITVVGTGDCSVVWPNRESAHYFYVAF